MSQQHPPTPPTNGTDYHATFQQVAQYNADSGFSTEEDGYSSTSAMLHKGIPSRTARIDSHTGESLGLGISFVSSPCFHVYLHVEPRS